MNEIEEIRTRIHVIRGQQVMLDFDLAELYGVETRVLNQAVRRNIERFPEDFMFQLTDDELRNWKSQIVISNSIKMGLRKNPLAFTEQGVAMLSGVLRSPIAIQVNIRIMRAFGPCVSTSPFRNGRTESWKHASSSWKRPSRSHCATATR